VSTDQDTYQDLGGPSLTVEVPPSGLVDVLAQVDIGNDEGAVALYDGNGRASGQDPLCGANPPTDSGLLLADPNGAPTPTVRVATGTTPSGSFAPVCGSLGPPTPVLFQLSPGTHTLSLRYAYCGCNPPSTAEFSNRKLWASPRP
jgi:hypothetical protein